ncbi:MAG TPA: hypothetical protein VHA73_09520 [Acidimicrobiales bacterium]|nr:hypothetical protein [Acidimicrobiales bacterium]
MAESVLTEPQRELLRLFFELPESSNRFDLDGLLDTAAAIDPCFDTDVLVQMLGTLDRFVDDELLGLGANPSSLRSFIADWQVHLTSRPT